MELPLELSAMFRSRPVFLRLCRRQNSQGMTQAIINATGQSWLPALQVESFSAKLLRGKGSNLGVGHFFAPEWAESGYSVFGGYEDMTKADLVEKVTSVGDLTRRDGEVIVETTFDAVIGALKSGDKIEIRGFGSFRTRQRNPRIGRNPKTGERVEVPAKKVPYFKPSKELRDLVNPQEAAKAS
jgi:integration host factor subunit beta